MPYYYRRSAIKKTSRPPSNNPWQRKGETMSLNNACAQYGVTEEQVKEANLECQWRSSFGNLYPVVKVSDILDLKRKLAKEEEERKQKELVEKYGEEGLAEMKRQEAEKAKAEAAAREREKSKKEVTDKILEISNLCDAPMPVQNVLIAKTAAKKDWFLQDAQLEGLSKTQEGRSVKFELKTVIQKAENKHGHSSLKEKLLKRGDTKTVAEYAGFMLMKLQSLTKVQNYSGLIAEARVDAKAFLQKQLDDSKEAARRANDDVTQKENRIRSFERMSFGGATDAENVPPEKRARVQS